MVAHLVQHCVKADRYGKHRLTRPQSPVQIDDDQIIGADIGGFGLRKDGVGDDKGQRAVFAQRQRQVLS